MAMLTRRPRTPAPAPVSAWDPFRMMRELMRMEPASDLEQVGGEFIPEFEMKETDDAFVIKGDLPGIKEDDIDISCSGQSLTVSGKREEEDREEGETYYRFERSYGSFTRTFTMPETADLDSAQAALEGGVLTIRMPKRENAKARKISVSKSAQA